MGSLIIAFFGSHQNIRVMSHKCSCVSFYRTLLCLLNSWSRLNNEVLHYQFFGGIHWWTVDYDDVIMGAIASQITSLTIVYSIVYSDADQRKHQSSASLAFVRVIHRGPVNSPHKWPVTRKMFPFDDVIMGFPTERASYAESVSKSKRLRDFTENVILQKMININIFIFLSFLKQPK